MQVKDVMKREVITVSRSTSLRDLLQKFTNFHMFPLVPVVEEDNHLVGIVSFRNLINVFSPSRPEILKTIPFLDEEQENIFNTDLNEEIGNLVVVEDIMESKFVSIQEDASLEDVFRMMKFHLKEEFPVVDRLGKLVGMVGIFDIIQQVFRQKGII